MDNLADTLEQITNLTSSIFKTDEIYIIVKYQNKIFILRNHAMIPLKDEKITILWEIFSVKDLQETIIKNNKQTTIRIPIRYNNNMLGLLIIKTHQFDNIIIDSVSTQLGNIIGIILNKYLQNNKLTSKIKYLSHHDFILTQLPNRLYLFSILRQSIFQKTEYQTLALFFLDIDNFKEVNRLFGHKFGDLILKKFAIRLNDLIKDTKDFISVGRMGGDEFAIIYTSSIAEHDISNIADQIMNSFMIPFRIRCDNYRLSISMGISIYQNLDTTADILIQEADKAMYTAKNNGKNCYHIYDNNDY